MQQKIQRALQRLGYSHNAIFVYLTLLQMGEGTVTEIAKKAKLPRSTTQLVVAELQGKGLVSLSFKREHQVWVAENPSRFLSELHDKEVMVKKLLPELLKLRKQSKKKPVLKYFSGKKSVRHVLDEVLTAKLSIKAFGSIAHLSEYLGEFTVEDFFQTILSRSIPIEILSPDSELLLQLKNDSSPAKNSFRTLRNERLENVFYFLYDNKVALVILNQQETIAVTIDDENLFSSWELFYSLLFKEAELF